MKATPLLRSTIVVVLFGGIAPACEREPERGTEAPAATPAERPAVSATPVKQLQPWETVDVMFDGCAGGCGMRLTGPTEGVVAQPGAILGQRAYCPVSGVAFDVKATSAQRLVGDKLLYFCCESCAAYFTANRATILAARGIAA